MGRRGTARWAIGWATAVGVQLVLPSLPGAAEPIGSAHGLFWLVVVAASLCVVGAAAVIAVAWRGDVPELGIAGVFFLAVSVLPLVHGITVPGVLYGGNEATMTAVLWALPVASASALPLLLGRRSGRWLLRRWRLWVAGCIVVQVGLAIGLLVQPSMLPFAAMGDPLAVVLALAGLGPCLVLSARHLRLYWIGHAPGSLGVALGFALVCAANLVWIEGVPMGLAFWAAHLIDIAGVLLATVAAAVAYRGSGLRRALLAPFVVREPLEALELGLDPVVRRFVGELERKDSITRDHVVRVGELAMQVGAELRLAAPELRVVGIGALLHDVGKLAIDDAVLNKPGRLTSAEFEHMQTHARIGADLVAGSPVIAPAAPVVLYHHERFDGRGYPTGLRGESIPLGARIVSVCDAFDAMAHTRQYREGMGYERAIAVLREHSGSQWDAGVVDALIRLVDEDRVAAAPTVLGEVGREAGCACGDLVFPVLV